MKTLIIITACLLISYKSLAQTMMLGYSQDDVMIKMKENYRELFFVQRDKVLGTDNDELEYVDENHVDYVFTFNKADTCVAFSILDLQRNLPTTLEILRKEFIKTEKDHWEDILHNLKASLETITTGQIFVLKFEQMNYIRK